MLYYNALNSYTPMKKLFFLFFTLLSFTSGHAQWLWARTNVAEENSIVEAAPLALDSAGNVFIAGFYLLNDSFTISPYSLQDPGAAFIAKYNPLGAIQWLRGLGDASTDVLSMATDKPGNLYILGLYSDSITIGITHLTNDSGGMMNFLAKYDAGGNAVWAKNIAPERYSAYLLGDIAVDDNANIYTSGSYRASSVTIDGHTINNSWPGGDSSDIYVIKFNDQGIAIWAKSFGGNADDFSPAISLSKSGMLHVLGKYHSQYVYIGNDTLVNLMYGVGVFPNPASFLAEMDTAGNMLWVKTLDKHIAPADIAADPSGNCYVVGSIDSTIVFGNDTLADSINQFWQITASFAGMFDVAGNIVWGRTANAVLGGCGMRSITLDSCNNLWIGGRAKGNIIFDSSALDTPLNSYDEAFFANYTPCGKYIGGTTLNSGGDDAMQVAVDNRANLYFGADYEHVAIPVQQDTLQVPPLNTEQLLLAKYNYGQIICDTTHCLIHDTAIVVNKVQTPLQNSFSLYPNPAVNSFTLSCSDNMVGSTLLIYDALGRVIYNKPLVMVNTVISAAGWQPGLYECSVIAKDGSRLNRKLLVTN